MSAPAPGQAAVASLINMAKAKGIPIPSGGRPEWLVTLLGKYGSAAKAGVPASADDVLNEIKKVYDSGCDLELSDVISEAIVGLGIPQAGGRRRKVGGGFRELGNAISGFFTSQCRRGAAGLDKLTTSMAQAIDAKAAEAEANPADVLAALRWAAAAGAVVAGTNEGLRNAIVNGLIKISAALPTVGTLFTNTVSAIELSLSVAAGSGMIAGQLGLITLCIYVVYALREKLMSAGKAATEITGKQVWDVLKTLVTNTKYKEFMADLENERKAIEILDAELDGMKRTLKPEVAAVFAIPPRRQRRQSLAALAAAPMLPGGRRRHHKTKKTRAGRRRLTSKRGKSF